MKLIIWIPGKPMVHGFKRREYIWSVEHGCHIYLGREFSPEEFNSVVEKAIRNNMDMHPLVKVMPGATADAALRAQISKLEEQLNAHPVPEAPPAPVTTIAQGREISLEEAEAVVFRLAPHKFKKAPAVKVAKLDVG
jgi:hypothetical protein